MTLLSRACVTLTVSEIFGVKEWGDVETGGRGCSKGH